MKYLEPWTREDNWIQFRRWQQSVIRLAQRDRYKNDQAATLKRIIKRAIDSAVCDCHTCIVRIVEEDKRVNWPNCAAEQRRSA